MPQKKAALQAAEIDFERTVIRSPVDGVVIGRSINPGQTLATTLEAKTLFIIAGNLRRMEIHSKVDEADIGRIQVGQEAIFTVDAHPDRQFRAAVRQIRIAPQVQQNVVTYAVVLSADNSDNFLLPGMTAFARITVSGTESALKLPLAAVRFTPKAGVLKPGQSTTVTQGKPALVWVVERGGQPKPVAIGLGDEDASHVAVISGLLAPGDQVIVGESTQPPDKRLFGIRIGI
jgi:HlyD family secretion protein